MGVKKSHNGGVTDAQIDKGLDRLLEKLLAMGSNNGTEVVIKADDQASKNLEKITDKTNDAANAMQNLEKAAQNTSGSITKSMEQAGKSVQNNAKKLIKNTTTEFAKLSRIFGSSKHENTLMRSYANWENVFSDDIDKKVSESADKSRRNLEKSIDKYKSKMENLFYDVNSYKAEGKHSSPLYKESDLKTVLFDEKEVELAKERFVNSIKESNKTISKSVLDMIDTREKLYSAYKTIGQRVNFNETDFSDKDKNEQMLTNLSNMIKISKHIEHLDSKIGVKNNEHNIDKNLVGTMEQMVENIVGNNGIAQAFKGEYKEAKVVMDAFFDYLTNGMNNRGFGKDIASKYFESLENASKNAAQQVKNDTASIKDDLKNAERYINDRTKFERGTTASNAWNKLNKTGNQKINRDSQYALVSEIANIRRNGGNIDESKKSYSEYVKKWLEEDDELKQLYNIVRNFDPSKIAKHSPAQIVDIEQANKQTEALNKLTYACERAKALGIDTSKFELVDSSEVKDIEAATEAVSKLIEAKERAKQTVKVPVVEKKDTKEDSLSLKDNTGMSYDEKIAKVKELISYHQTLLKFNQLDTKYHAEGLDDKEEKEYDRLQNKLLSVDDAVENFRECYKGLKLELKDGTVITATADSLERLSNVKPGNIKNITMEYNELHYAVSNLEKSMDLFDGNIVSSLGYYAQQGDWADLIDTIKRLDDPIKELQTSFNMTEQEATDFYNKINLLDEKLWTDKGITTDNNVINTLNEVSEIAQNKYKELALSVKTAFEEAEAVCKSSGEKLSDYISDMFYKDHAQDILSTPINKQALTDAKSLTQAHVEAGNAGVDAQNNIQLEVEESKEKINDLKDTIKWAFNFLYKEDGGLVTKLLFGEDGFLKSKQQLLKEIETEFNAIQNKFLPKLNDNTFSEEEWISDLSNVFNKFGAANAWGILKYEDMGALNTLPRRGFLSPEFFKQIFRKSSGWTITYSLSDDYFSIMRHAIDAQKELQDTMQKTTSLPLTEEKSGQLAFVEGLDKSTKLIEEESGQMTLFETNSKKATDTAIEGQMHLNDYINKNIEGQMTLNDLLANQSNNTNQSGVLFGKESTPNVKQESETVKELANSYKELSSIKDLQENKSNGNYSQTLVDGLSEAMAKMKAFYDAGQTDSLEYYAVLSRIVNIQKEMWKYSGGGKTAPADQLSQSNKNYDDRLSMQDGILADFMKFKSTTDDVVDFVVQQFSNMRHNIKGSFAGIFDESGKILSQKMREELSEMFDPIGNQTVVDNLKQEEQASTNAADAVVQAEEKKRKYRLASLSEIPKLAEQEQQTYDNIARFAEQSAERVVAAEQKAQASTESTGVIVANEEQQKKAAEESASAVVNAEKAKQQAYEETERVYGIVEGAKYNDLTRSNSGTPSIPNNADNLSGVDTSNFKVLRQVGELGVDSKAIVTYQNAYGQILTVIQKLDEAGNIVTEDNGVLTTSFKDLEKQVKSTYASIISDKAKLKGLKSKYGDKYDDTAIRSNIAKNEQHLEALLVQSEVYANDKKYAVEYNQFLKEYSAIKDQILSNQSIKNASIEAKALTQQEEQVKKLEQIKSKFDKKLSSINGGFKHLTEYSDVQNAIKNLVNLEDVSKVETAFNKLEEVINSFKQNVKKSNSLDPVFSAMNTRKNIDNIVEEYRLKFKEVGYTAEEVEEKIKILFESAERIKGINLKSKTGMTDLGKELNTFYAEKENLDSKIRISKSENRISKQAEKAYKDQYKLIENYSKAQDNLNTLLMQQEKNGKSNELTAKIASQRQEVEKLKLEAKAATEAIQQMSAAGSITTDQREKAYKLYGDVRDGKTASFSILEGVKKDNTTNVKATYSDSLHWLKSEVEKRLKTFNSELGTFEKLTNAKADGTATITFVNELADSTQKATIQVKDLLQVLVDLESKNFDPKTAGTYKIAEITRKDVEKAYKTMADTEEDYRKLSIKRTAGTATKEQLAELKEIQHERKKAASIIRLKTAATEEEIEAQRKYNNVQEQTNDKIKDFVNNEKTVKSLMDSSSQMLSGFSSKNISGSDIAFSNANEKVKQLNESLQNGKISAEKYSKEILKVSKDLNSILFGNVESDNAESAMNGHFRSIGVAEKDIGKFDDVNKTLTATFVDQDKKIRNVTLKYDELNKAIKIVKSTTEGSKSFLTQFVEGLKHRVMALGQYLLSFESFYDVINKIRQGVTYVRELDTALTEMRKVSDETVKSLRKFQDVSFDIAKSVGTTAKQIQESTADFMRLGESLEEAAKSAEVANILLNVSEFESIDEATESLVSMSAAFDELEKIDIIDKLNLIGNNFAISTDGLATALQNSASSLKTANNDIDESIALATAANAVVQDPDKVGAGLRTIALRITGTESAKEELAELGEDIDDFIVTTSSKLNQQVMDLTKTVGKNGISLLDDNGNYRSTYEILQDIADVWEQIAEEDLATGQNRQNALLEMLAGKNRSNILASILQSPETLRDAYNASLNDSAGSAEEELTKYLDSIEGKIQLFQNRLQEFWYNLIDSDVVKKVVDAGIELINILDNVVSGLSNSGIPNLIIDFLTNTISLISKLTDGLGSLSTVLAGVLGVSIFKKIKEIDSGGRAKKVCPQSNQICHRIV